MALPWWQHHKHSRWCSLMVMRYINFAVCLSVCLNASPPKLLKEFGWNFVHERRRGSVPDAASRAFWWRSPQGSRHGEKKMCHWCDIVLVLQWPINKTEWFCNQAVGSYVCVNCMYDAFGVSADACCGYTADYCDSDKLGVARWLKASDLR